MHFAQSSLELNKNQKTKENKKQGSIWYLDKFKRICVDFPITLLQVTLKNPKN